MCLGEPADSVNTGRSDSAMNERNEDVRDRELFSELLETPIHLLLVNMVPPYVEENNPMFLLQLNGEVVWKWREVCYNL